MILNRSLQGLLIKQAYGGSDEWGIYDRFEPLYYGREGMDTEATANAVKRFAAALEEINPNLRTTFSNEKYEEGISAEDMIKKMRAGKGYPYFYTATTYPHGKELGDEEHDEIYDALNTSLGPNNNIYDTVNRKNEKIWNALTPEQQIAIYEDDTPESPSEPVLGGGLAGLKNALRAYFKNRKLK